jgi:uncharacterized repeat protein (TIGR02543 family)
MNRKSLGFSSLLLLALLAGCGTKVSSSSSPVVSSSTPVPESTGPVRANSITDAILGEIQHGLAFSGNLTMTSGKQSQSQKFKAYSKDGAYTTESYSDKDVLESTAIYSRSTDKDSDGMVQTEYLTAQNTVAKDVSELSWDDSLANPFARLSAKNFSADTDELPEDDNNDYYDYDLSKITEDEKEATLGNFIDYALGMPGYGSQFLSMGASVNMLRVESNGFHIVAFYLVLNISSMGSKMSMSLKATIDATGDAAYGDHEVAPFATSADADIVKLQKFFDSLEKRNYTETIYEEDTSSSSPSSSGQFYLSEQYFVNADKIGIGDGESEVQFLVPNADKTELTQYINYGEDLGYYQYLQSQKVPFDGLFPTLGLSASLFTASKETIGGSSTTVYTFGTPSVPAFISSSDFSLGSSFQPSQLYAYFQGDSLVFEASDSSSSMIYEFSAVGTTHVGFDSAKAHTDASTLTMSQMLNLSLGADNLKKVEDYLGGESNLNVIPVLGGTYSLAQAAVNASSYGLMIVFPLGASAMDYYVSGKGLDKTKMATDMNKILESYKTKLTDKGFSNVAVATTTNQSFGTEILTATYAFMDAKDSNKKVAELSLTVDLTMTSSYSFALSITGKYDTYHTVTLNSNYPADSGKESTVSTLPVKDNVAPTLPTPTLDGYTFGGWYTDAACTTPYGSKKGVTEDITLYAKWTKNDTSTTAA